ncbi:MAG: hypothetical protein LBI18_14760 [Planctomycetaceae bacterium]|nr:hypothetical protein [Planctomycetaceae bacterium]
MAGILWRKPYDIDVGRDLVLVLVFTVWVIVLLFLSRISQQPEHRKNHNIFWVPVLLIGFLLPFPLPILYVSLLGIAEVVRRFPARKIDKKILVPATMSVPENSENEDDFDEFDQENDFDRSITQKIVRRFTETGKDQVEGIFLVGFQDSQLTATIHIPFCPAFEYNPKVEVFLLDDVDVKWNIFEPRPFGVRIDLKRNSCEIQQTRIMVVAE